jgi:hypothetical protein
MTLEQIKLKAFDLTTDMNAVVKLLITEIEKLTNDNLELRTKLDEKCTCKDQVDDNEH